MNYFICQDWKSTNGNHAGMVHLCKSIEKLDPHHNRVIIVRYDWHEVNIVRRFRKYIFNFDIYKLIYFIVTLSILPKIRKNDKIFLMEYLHKEKNQLITAKLIRYIFGKNVQIFGMVHLFPDKLSNWFSDKDFKTWTYFVDRVLTLGSSLSDFLKTKGVPAEKIITTFHYVDCDYYRNNTINCMNSPLKVIAMGNLYRNYDMLAKIVKQVPEVEFHICKGLDQIDDKFIDISNVKLHGYLSEDELKNIMNMCDVSLNVMTDTIGSNVITTSMSMGLAMLVSDVGSIRNYCDETNAIFCNTFQDFIKSILFLDSYRDSLEIMKISSFEKSRELSIPNFYKQIENW